MDGTRHNQYGTTIPTYFCMDDFGGDRPLTTFADTISAEVGKTKMVNLNPLLPAVDTKGASIEYAITDGADNTLADIFRVNKNRSCFPFTPRPRPVRKDMQRFLFLVPVTAIEVVTVFGNTGQIDDPEQGTVVRPVTVVKEIGRAHV